jgi:hypothetical protein
VKKVKEIMKNHKALLTLAFSIAFAGPRMGASTIVSPSPGTNKSSQSEAQLSKVSPAASSGTRAHASHFFPVNDEKGLLLTCIAPDIDTNPNTDLFTDCALAPGRTLNDVMHSFVGAMHFEEKERAGDRDEGIKAHEEKPAQTTAQK